MSHWAEPPEQEQAYDPQRAPAAPTLVDAYLFHNYESQTFGSCGGTSSCGDLHGLQVLLTVEGSEPPLLRITHEDGSKVYARAHLLSGDGRSDIVLPGYADVHDDMAFQIALIDANGYPSLDVEWVARNEEDNDPSCSAGGSNAAGLSTTLLVVLGLMLGLRRKRQRAVMFW